MPRNNPVLTMTAADAEYVVLGTLESSGFLMLNRLLLKTLGPECTVYLAYLIDKYRLFKEDMDGDWFYCTQDRIEEDLAMSAKRQNTALDELKGHGLLQTKIAGVPAKKYYRIEWMNVLSFLGSLSGQKGKASSAERAELAMPKGRSIYNVLRENGIEKPIKNNSAENPGAMSSQENPSPSQAEKQPASKHTGKAARQRADARPRQADPAIQRIVDDWRQAYAAERRGQEYPVNRSRDYPAAKQAAKTIGEDAAKKCARWFLVAKTTQWERDNQGTLLHVALGQKVVSKWQADSGGREGRKSGGFHGARVQTFSNK